MGEMYIRKQARFLLYLRTGREMRHCPVCSILLTKYGVISYRQATNLLIESGGGKRPCEATATGHYDARC